MRYPPHLLDEIRARLPASDVIGRRVRLKKAGREWKGLSPFNAEKTPSFYVNDQKQFYHCFSSGKHGDIFTFLMETEGLSFPEAVERLASEAGVALPAPSEDTRATAQARRGALDVMEMAAAWYEARLRAPEGREASAYLDRRGLSQETRARFRLGYAPAGRYGLRDHLAERGVERDLMVELGLLKAGEDVAVPYDRMRDRVIFPITDGRGRVIAFGGRALRADVPAKYLNSPETPLFHKGRTLYNLHAARAASHERGTIIAVEGYVDVIAMTMAGHPETVAPLGTALTEEQLALLWRHADEPVLCFDGDGAGQRAAFRALDLALPLLTAEKSLKFAAFPSGQDPDDLFRSGGPAAIDAVLARAGGPLDIIVAKALLGNSRETPEQQARFVHGVRADIARVADRTLRFAYNDAFTEQLRAAGPARGPEARGPRSRAPTTFIRVKPSPSVIASPGFTGGGSVREAVIVGTLLAHPDLIEPFAEALSELDFADADARALVPVLLDCAAQEVEPDAAVLAARLARAGLEPAAARLVAAARSRDRKTLDPHADPAQRADALEQAMTLHRQAGALNNRLRDAQRAFADEPTDAHWAWFLEAKEQLDIYLKAEAEADLPQATEATAP